MECLNNPTIMCGTIFLKSNLKCIQQRCIKSLKKKTKEAMWNKVWMAKAKLQDRQLRKLDITAHEEILGLQNGVQQKAIQK